MVFEKFSSPRNAYLIGLEFGDVMEKRDRVELAENRSHRNLLPLYCLDILSLIVRRMGGGSRFGLGPRLL